MLSQNNDIFVICDKCKDEKVGIQIMDENKDILDIDQGMEYALDDKEFYIETLQIYLEETNKNKGLMDKYLETGEIKDYAILAHSLKSSSRLVGAVSLSESAERMELEAKADNLQYVKDNHLLLMMLLQQVHSAINTYLEERE